MKFYSKKFLLLSMSALIAITSNAMADEMNRIQRRIDRNERQQARIQNRIDHMKLDGETDTARYDRRVRRLNGKKSDLRELKIEKREYILDHPEYRPYLSINDRVQGSRVDVSSESQAASQIGSQNQDWSGNQGSWGSPVDPADEAVTLPNGVVVRRGDLEAAYECALGCTEHHVHHYHDHGDGGKVPNTPSDPGKVPNTVTYDPGKVPNTVTYDPGKVPNTVTYDPGKVPNTVTYDPGKVPNTVTYDPGKVPNTATFDPGKLPNTATSTKIPNTPVAKVPNASTPVRRSVPSSHSHPSRPKSYVKRSPSKPASKPAAKKDDKRVPIRNGKKVKLACELPVAGKPPVCQLPIQPMKPTGNTLNLNHVTIVAPAPIIMKEEKDKRIKARYVSKQSIKNDDGSSEDLKVKLKIKGKNVSKETSQHILETVRTVSTNATKAEMTATIANAARDSDSSKSSSAAN